VANETTLKVVGTGPLESDLRSRYREAEFLGYRSGDALKQIVANAAFVVVPSEWYENCPMVVLEAMAMGKPVIGSAIGGIPEQIDHGQKLIMERPAFFLKWETSVNLLKRSKYYQRMMI
jgi:glycosyltransferase involved in cell wall biosynthesis